MKNKKQPWLAAVLNFVLPGAGYLYIGIRIRFSTLLIAAMALLTFGPAPEYTEGIEVTPEMLAQDSGFLIMALAALMIAAGFAYDAYGDASRYNRARQAIKEKT